MLRADESYQRNRASVNVFFGSERARNRSPFSSAERAKWVKNRILSRRAKVNCGLAQTREEKCTFDRSCRQNWGIPEFVRGLGSCQTSRCSSEDGAVCEGIRGGERVTKRLLQGFLEFSKYFSCLHLQDRTCEIRDTRERPSAVRRRPMPPKERYRRDTSLRSNFAAGTNWWYKVCCECHCRANNDVTSRTGIDKASLRGTAGGYRTDQFLRPCGNAWLCTETRHAR